MCHFVTFLVGGVPRDFFNVKNVPVAQKRLKNTAIGDE